MKTCRTARPKTTIRRPVKRAPARAHDARSEAKRAAKSRAAELRGQILVNPANLRPTNSYGTPDFVTRGYYVDKAFKCKTCGAPQVWTATQQRWWYELAKGDVWTVAVLCRPCRRRERARKAVARSIHLAGLMSKHQP